MNDVDLKGTASSCIPVPVPGHGPAGGGGSTEDALLFSLRMCS